MTDKTPKVYVVVELGLDDPSDDQPVVAYGVKAEADRHAADFDKLIVYEVPLAYSYTPDPEALAARDREREDQRLEADRYKESAQRQDESAARMAALDPATVKGKRLCTCRSFSSSLSLMRSNGYCGYCGNWDAAVFTPDELAAAVRWKQDWERKRSEEDLRRSTAHVG